MKKLLLLSLLLGSELYAGLAHAECVTQAQATPTSTCVVYALNGVPGVWFSLSEADNIRRDRLELPELRLQVSRLERAMELQDRRVEFYREANTELSEAITLLQTQIEQGLTREDRLRRQLLAWYRSPVLWLSAGILVTTVTYVSLQAAIE